MTELPKAQKLGYSIAEACAATSLGRTTIYAHIAAGRLRIVRLGGRTVIPAESLMAFLAADANHISSKRKGAKRGTK
jgi:excisionase family DNA binding protein